MPFIPTIGLEVHAQLLTRSKAFCSCPTGYGAPPNTQTCPVCLGMPGVLPVLNRGMVDLALRAALALNCQVSWVSQFARKNYFYPDLPKGYQISQYDKPLAENGWLELEYAGSARRIGVRRVHLEEDAGKSFHLDVGHSLVDMNRCGVPLIEIVSEPDVSSPEEAKAYLIELKRILEYLGICSGDMEKGALRCDANVSLKDPKTAQLGISTEVKNLNSFRAVQRALKFEIERQAAILQSGGRIARETLLWDEAAGVARPMRAKELAHDYRYFPEPDLVLLEVDEKWLEEVRSRLPELPQQKERRLAEQYGIRKDQAEILCADPALSAYFEAVAEACGQAALAAGFILTDVLRYLHEAGITISEFQLDSRNLAELLKLIDKGSLSMPLAREVFQEMLSGGETAQVIVARRGLELIRDEETILPLIRQVIEQYPAEVQRYLTGETKLSRFFMGQLMKLTRGQGDPARLSELLERELKSPQ